MQQRQRNSWKTLGLAIAFAVPALLVVGAVVGMLEDDRRMEQLASVVIANSAPPASAVEECNRFAGQAYRGDEDDANAPADAGKNASQRAPGTLVGMSEQNSRSAATRAAFRDCMMRKGYAS